LASLTKKRFFFWEFLFGAFPGDKKSNCVWWNALRQYEKVSPEFQPPETRENPLSLSYTHPHKPVTSQRLVHWVKDLLAKDGVDDSV